MSTKILKYRINEALKKLSIADHAKALRTIPKELTISSATFNNYRSITIEDKQDIPHEKVLMLERIFGLECGELENYTIHAKPLQFIPDLEAASPIKVTGP